MDFPEETYLDLVSKAKSQRKKKNLTSIHSLCRELHKSGVYPFSKSEFSPILTQNEIMNGRALYNKASADYVRLIEAWNEYSNKNRPAEISILHAKEEWIESINNPATKILIRNTVSELNKVKAQLSILKGQTELTIYLGNRASTPESSGVPDLTSSEISSLKKSVSAEFFENEDMVIGEHGEVLKMQSNGKTRVLYDVGYIPAMMKLLKSCENRMCK